MMLLCLEVRDFWKLICLEGRQMNSLGERFVWGGLGVGENYTETQSRKVVGKYNSNLGITVIKNLWKAFCKLFVWSTMLGFT